MKESSESYPIYIAVDSSKIARCKWCGTAESEHWEKTQKGIYCSGDCKMADGAISNAVGYFICMISVLIPFLSLPVLFPLMNVGFVLPYLPLLGLFPVLYFGLKGLYLRKNIIRGSRRDEGSSKLALLRSVASTVSCPKCDGNIDLTGVGEDMVYTCEYCGASGRIRTVETHRT